MLSHDWPRGVYNYGNVTKLLRYKKHFTDEINQDRLGSPPARDIMDTLKPRFWFSAHLHCKFAAIVPHQAEAEGAELSTKFLALDKCLPRRQFLQVLNIGEELKEDETANLKYCPLWLSVLRSTNHLLSVERKPRYTPGPGSVDKWDFRPSEQEVAEVKTLFKDDLDVPYNFEQTALAFRDTGERINMRNVPQPQATTNSQTTSLCSLLGIHDPMALLLGSNNPGFSANKFQNKRQFPTEPVVDDNEIDLSEIVDDNEDSTEDATFQGSKFLDALESPKPDESSNNKKPISIPQPKEENSQEQFQVCFHFVSAECRSNAMF